MRAKFLATIMQSVFLGMGLLVMVPPINPTSAGKPSNPHPAATYVHTSPLPIKLNSTRPKPLAVWECTSSWYGDDFDGQPTANGETYDMYAATAAHPTLPLGSIVRVVNTRNHRSQIVRINDRGPYIEGRELDVSYEVARRLGFDQHGIAKVRLELLEVPARPRTTERAD
ncbi:MAG: septal ring lytic transglycosylase RlpA family protein [Candidatus Acidiferrales bacterium]